jgi:hypothetical protein
LSNSSHFHYIPDFCGWKMTSRSKWCFSIRNMFIPEISKFLFLQLAMWTRVTLECPLKVTFNFQIVHP